MGRRDRFHRLVKRQAAEEGVLVQMFQRFALHRPSQHVEKGQGNGEVNDPVDAVVPIVVLLRGDGRDRFQERRTQGRR